MPGYPGEPTGTNPNAGGVSGGSILAGAIPLVGGIVSAGIQAGQNKKAREFAQQQALQQRGWSLQDWTMQNEYNSPASQMARLREAGLNPNLVYGKGADNTSQAIRSSPPAQWNPKAPEIDTGMVMSQYQDFRMRQAQTDNLKVQNTVLLAEQVLKTELARKAIADTGRSVFDVKKGETLLSGQADMLQAQIRKLGVDTEFTQHADVRAAIGTATNVFDATTRALKAQSEIANNEMERKVMAARIKEILNDAAIKGELLRMYQNNVTPHDSLFQRWLGTILDNMAGKNFRSFLQDKPKPNERGVLSNIFNQYRGNPGGWRK